VRSMPGALVDAERAGEAARECHWCGGWVWWPPEHELTSETRAAGRVFHSHGKCELREREARRVP
jgi:hypothetical protein